jgi:hypothetical protein
MLLSTPELGQLFLTADLQQPEARVARAFPDSNGSAFGSMLHRFPPIEELVASLDHIASRGIAA